MYAQQNKMRLIKRKINNMKGIVTNSKLVRYFYTGYTVTCLYITYNVQQTCTGCDHVLYLIYMGI